MVRSMAWLPVGSFVFLNLFHATFAVDDGASMLQGRVEAQAPNFLRQLMGNNRRASGPPEKKPNMLESFVGKMFGIKSMEKPKEANVDGTLSDMSNTELTQLYDTLIKLKQDEDVSQMEQVITEPFTSQSEDQETDDMAEENLPEEVKKGREIEKVDRELRDIPMIPVAMDRPNFDSNNPDLIPNWVNSLPTSKKKELVDYAQKEVESESEKRNLKVGDDERADEAEEAEEAEEEVAPQNEGDEYEEYKEQPGEKVVERKKGRVEKMIDTFDKASDKTVKLREERVERAEEVQKKSEVQTNFDKLRKALAVKHEKINWSAVNADFKRITNLQNLDVPRIIHVVADFLHPNTSPIEPVEDEDEGLMLRATHPDEWLEQEYLANEKKKAVYELPLEIYTIPVYLPEKHHWKEWAKHVLRANQEGSAVETLPQSIGEVVSNMTHAVLRPSIQALEATASSVIFRMAKAAKMDQVVKVARIIDAVQQASGGNNNNLQSVKPGDADWKDLEKSGVYVGGKKVDWGDVWNEIQNFQKPGSGQTQQFLSNVTANGFEHLSAMAEKELKRRVYKKVKDSIAKARAKNIEELKKPKRVFDMKLKE